jgi:HPt (histidine-containing phosphotransfer) domain-containing protein
MADSALPLPSSFDWAALLAKFDGDEAFARGLLGIVQRTNAAMPADLRAAAAAGDFAVMARLAHKVKGTAGDICATRLRAQAEAAELSSRQSLPAATGQLGELADSLHALLQDLQSVATTDP